MIMMKTFAVSFKTKLLNTVTAWLNIFQFLNVFQLYFLESMYIFLHLKDKINYSYNN